PHLRVIKLDNRGAGRSSAPDRPYTIRQMADDTVALMEHMGVAKANILGFSMGGYIAQELALAHPGKVEKLILLGTAPDIDGYGRAVVNAWVSARRSNLSREAIARLTAAWLYSPELLNDEARYEGAIANTLANPYAQQDHAFLRQARAVLSWEGTGERLNSIKAPTLVLCGKDDNLVPPRNSERLAGLIPGAELRILAGGHVGAIENPAEYNSAILGFLGAKTAAGAPA
ncbi:MAG: alpha/beta fold hydrolase, partial [Dehalococcoidia bacterium]